MLRLLLVLALSSWLVVSAQYPQGHNVSFYFRSCSLSGRLANGMCCDINATENCPAHCDVHFVVCVREHNETSNFCNSMTSSHISFLHYAYLNRHDITFFEGDNIFGVGLHNPLVYSFSGNWSKRIQTVLIARDFDFDFSFTNIDYIDVNWTVPAGREVDNRTFNGTYNNMVVNVGLKVDCWEGWYGEYCTVFCVQRDNSSGHYDCTGEGEKRCLEGWIGVYCNHTTCNNISCVYPFMCEDRSCVCPSETDRKCNVSVGVCEVSREPGDCGNGECINDLNSTTGYRCACDTGYTGETCRDDIDDCASAPCGNGGNCTDSLNAFFCDCERGYDGERCENVINLCDVNTCLNGGTCVVQNAAQSCKCATGYVEPLCEKIEYCGRDSCYQKGECKGVSKDLKQAVCVCDPGYTGVFCEQLINYCTSSPCTTGATCYQGVDSYYCRCENGVPGCVEQGEAAISTNSIIPGVENSVTGLLGGVSLGVVLTLLGCVLVAFLLGLLHLRARKKRQRRRNDGTRQMSLNPLLISEQGDPLFAGTETFPMMEPPAYNSLIGDTSKDTFKTAIISEKHEVFENKIPL